MLWNLIFILYLILLSFFDIRSRQLPVSLLFSIVPFIIFYHVVGTKISTAFSFLTPCTLSLPLIVAGILVGIFFLFLSKVTHEAFGYGDSILILLLGSILGLWNLLSLLIIAFSLAASFSIFMLILKRFSRKSAFPFVPFLTVAYIGGVLLGLY